MSEELLLETPGIRITTERIVFHKTTVVIRDIVSTDVSKRRLGRNRWETGCTIIIVCGMAAFISPHWIPACITIFVVVGLVLLGELLSNNNIFVLTITTTNGIHYEISTRTRKEMELIQQHVNEAMTCSNTLT